TPSEWLTQRVRRSPHLGRFECRTIPNGIDTCVFRPLDKQEAKARLGLPRDQFCFLFFANNLADPRKGAQLLERTLKSHGLPPNSLLMLVGKGGEAVAAMLPGLSIKVIGYLEGKAQIAECLSAADCLLLLSEADNLPYTAIEAIACGCPVLARN